MILFFWSGHEVKRSVQTKDESITASSGTTAPFTLTRVEWMMCHRIKIDHVHRPLYTFFMKLIFQCSPALFNKRCHFQWNLYCVFLLDHGTNWTKVYLTIMIRTLHRQQIHQRSHVKRMALCWKSDKVAGSERDGSNSFSCGVILMITFQLASPLLDTSFKLLQAGCH